MEEKVKLDILVVEDTLKHQCAAKILLSNYSHEECNTEFVTNSLQIVSTFDEAADLIAGGPHGTKETKKSYDVVITDLFFTQGRGDCMGNKVMAEYQCPFGYAVALMALQEGTRYIAIASDANHHEDPMAYTLDFFKNKDSMKLDVYGKGCSTFKVFDTERLRDVIIQLSDGTIGPRDKLGDHIQENPTDKGYFRTPEGAEPVKNYTSVLDELLRD